MKTKNILLVFFLCIGLYSKAQSYVTIPDANFAAWLNSFYPSCMNGNQMDTTCSEIVNAVSATIQNNIVDLTGIQYFKNLQILGCNYNQLTSLPVLPNMLLELYCTNNQLSNIPILPNKIKKLYCGNNQITSITALPDSLSDLRCGGNLLTALPSLPNTLLNFSCYNNQFTTLPLLPNSLLTLICDNNQLINLPTLPGALKDIQCDNNQLTTLPPLPNSLQRLECTYNQLTSLPTLPASLQYLVLCRNQLTSLPSLPNSLIDMHCESNLLTNIPSLPASLTGLDCMYNQITSLPALPNGLRSLLCSHNQLTSLPSIPNTVIYLECHNNLLTSLPTISNAISMWYLDCKYNFLTSLPALPNSLTELRCNNNLLTGLPALPNGLKKLYCDNNNISCFPAFPNTLYYNYFRISPNPFTCLPNYISAMSNSLLNYPLCVEGDLLVNPHGCSSVSGIAGYAYRDINANCQKDSADAVVSNIPIKLYDSNNNLLAQTATFSNGAFNFVWPVGTYRVAIDTVGMPYMVQCAAPGTDSVVTTNVGNALAMDVNFDIICKPSTDIGVQSVFTQGFVFPGQPHTLNVVAGAMGFWYNLNCGAGISGQVEIQIQGPVTYIGPATGALTPSVSGNVFTYNISDFGTINNNAAFGLLFSTNTTAQSGNEICVDVAVTPTAADNNTSNNYFHFCYTVINSMDPNMKEGYPVSVLPGYDDYFIYTIHFQNTGTAPAFNILLADTLSPLLNLETFQLMNYSHNNIVTLIDNVLKFRFPNIMLPDSTSDEPGSKGFVQYRIKPIEILYTGVEVENKAYIYFDYNAPIVTNTAITEYVYVTAINGVNIAIGMALYPNPVTDLATLTYTSTKAQYIDISVFDMLGREVMHLNQSVDMGINSIPINTQVMNNGVYVIKVSNDMQIIKFVKY